MLPVGPHGGDANGDGPVKYGSGREVRRRLEAAVELDEAILDDRHRSTIADDAQELNEAGGGGTLVDL